MKKFLLLIIVFAALSCSKKQSNIGRIPILEVEGKILYKDEIDKIIPPNTALIDSADIAQRYIKKWVTEALMYENARRNIGNLSDIDKLVEEYRRSLIIHEYEQALVAERLEAKIPDEEAKAFYEKYRSKFTLEDNLIKGMLLIVPIGAPKMNDVRQWVRIGDTKSLEQIENYSLQNAISFDYFDKWTPFSEIAKKAPFVYDDSRSFVLNTKVAEVADSAKYYFLRISNAIPQGDIEPFDYVKERIFAIVLNRKKTDFIITFEKNVYEDAIKKGNVNFIKKK